MMLPEPPIVSPLVAPRRFGYQLVPLDGGRLALHLGSDFNRFYSDLNCGRSLDVLRAVSVIHGTWLARAGEHYPYLEHVTGDLLVKDRLTREDPATPAIFERLHQVSGTLYVAGNGMVASRLTDVIGTLDVYASIMAPDLRYVGHNLHIHRDPTDDPTISLPKLSVVGGGLRISRPLTCSANAALPALVCVGGSATAPLGWLPASAVTAIGARRVEQIRHLLNSDAASRRAALDDAVAPIANLENSERGLGL